MTAAQTAQPTTRRQSNAALRHESRTGRTTTRAPKLTVVPAARPHRVPFIIGLILTGLILVAFGFAAFHSQMAETQYDLEQVERDLALDTQRLESLRFQLEELNSPAEIELLARGVIGLVDPESPVDLVVADELLAEVAEVGSTDGSAPAITGGGR